MASGNWTGDVVAFDPSTAAAQSAGLTVARAYPPPVISTPSSSGSPTKRASSCALGLRWEGCGGAYQNAVLPNGCADPGVTFDGTRYLMTCTSGGAANAFPVYESPDLTSWTLATHIFSSG